MSPLEQTSIGALLFMTDKHKSVVGTAHKVLLSTHSVAAKAMRTNPAACYEPITRGRVVELKPFISNSWLS